MSAADAEEFQHRLPEARIVAMDATHNVQETAPRDLALLVGSATAAGI